MIDRSTDPPIVRLANEHRHAVGMFAGALVSLFDREQYDEEALEWVITQAALARPNAQLDEMRRQMDEQHRQTERRPPPIPTDAHAADRDARIEMYRRAHAAGFPHWQEGPNR